MHPQNCFDRPKSFWGSRAGDERAAQRHFLHREVVRMIAALNLVAHHRAIDRARLRCSLIMHPASPLLTKPAKWTADTGSLICYAQITVENNSASHPNLGIRFCRSPEPIPRLRDSTRAIYGDLQPDQAIFGMGSVTRPTPLLYHCHHTTN